MACDYDNFGNSPFDGGGGGGGDDGDGETISTALVSCDLTGVVYSNCM